MEGHRFVSLKQVTQIKSISKFFSKDVPLRHYFHLKSGKNIPYIPVTGQLIPWVLNVDIYKNPRTWPSNSPKTNRGCPGAGRWRLAPGCFGIQVGVSGTNVKVGHQAEELLGSTGCLEDQQLPGRGRT